MTVHYLTHRVSLDITLDQFAGGGVHGHLARTPNEAVGDNGLAVDTRQGFGGIVGRDGLFGRHYCFVSVPKGLGDGRGVSVAVGWMRCDAMVKDVSLSKEGTADFPMPAREKCSASKYPSRQWAELRPSLALQGPRPWSAPLSDRDRQCYSASALDGVLVRSTEYAVDNVLAPGTAYCWLKPSRNWS